MGPWVFFKNNKKLTEEDLIKIEYDFNKKHKKELLSIETRRTNKIFRLPLSAHYTSVKSYLDENKEISFTKNKIDLSHPEIIKNHSIIDLSKALLTKVIINKPDNKIVRIKSHRNCNKLNINIIFF